MLPKMITIKRINDARNVRVSPNIPQPLRDSPALAQSHVPKTEDQASSEPQSGSAIFVHFLCEIVRNNAISQLYGVQSSTLIIASILDHGCKAIGSISSCPDTHGLKFRAGLSSNASSQQAQLQSRYAMAIALCTQAQCWQHDRPSVGIFHHNTGHCHYEFAPPRPPVCCCGTSVCAL
jgi:hypothetical protein